MSGETFTLVIASPRKLWSREVRSLRLRDGTGFFGILPGHCDFLTVLGTALGYYRDREDREHFLALDGGIFCMQGGRGTITSREVYEGDDAERLAEIIADSLAGRDASELAFLRMIEGIERSFLEKSAVLGRERP
jgi:F-type H+-transporting ATPase subunit epsilon